MSALVEVSPPEIRLPFELGECLGLMTSCANMLRGFGLQDDANEVHRLSREMTAVAQRALDMLNARRQL